VPGLAAKPVIDIQVSVRSLRPRAAVIEPLIRHGFRHTIDPIETQHELLTSGYEPDAPRTVHVHVCEAGSAWEARHIAFRDHLRTHPDDARAYGSLKRRLAAEHPRDVQTYIDGKTSFIRAVEAHVLASG
jgi:GrpB-like predicted nucleotidyltransferase (UPF0157 family)